VVWPAWAWVDVHRHNGGTAPRENLDLRHQARSDRVADQVRESLLQIKRIADAANVASPVFHADQQCPAGGIGEGDDRLQDAVRRRELSLELEGLAFGPFEDLDELH
jgi:hypothetical protein